MSSIIFSFFFLSLNWTGVNKPQFNFTKEKIKELIHKNSYHNNKEQLVVKSIQTKIINNNSIITKAGKGNSLVALSKEDYDQKFNDILDKEPPQR